MPRVALRQFLRSSFDPADKTMGSPIIACLGAATLLILASCSFGSISATPSPDHSGEASSDDAAPESRALPPEPPRMIPVDKGFVRVSNYSGKSIGRPTGQRQTGIGSRAYGIHGKWTVSGAPNLKDKDYFTMFGEQLLLIISITAKQVDQGITNILSNMEKNYRGRIAVPAQTLKGALVGSMALKYFKHFFKGRWVAVIAHAAQEIVDRFYLGSEAYMEAIMKGPVIVGYRGESDTEDYTDVSVTAATLQIDMAEDFDQWEINEYEDPVAKTYHCSVQSQTRNDTLQPNLETIKFLDDNGLSAVRPKKNYYQVHQIRQKMCQFGFDPFQTDTRVGSIHKRFKNTLRLMIYNTPGIFPGLKVIRNDLDRKRRREPQIWFTFEASTGPLSSEFDYDNYFVTVSGDFARIQAYSKMLVALKMHKRLNNFNNSVSYKINLDLGIMEVIMSSFGIALMREKSTASLLVKALNGVRTEIKDDDMVQLEFEESLKEAADQVDPLLYSSIWLLSMAEKYEVVRIRDRARSIQVRSVKHEKSPVE